MGDGFGGGLCLRCSSASSSDDCSSGVAGEEAAEETNKAEGEGDESGFSFRAAAAANAGAGETRSDDSTSRAAAATATLATEAWRGRVFISMTKGNEAAKGAKEAGKGGGFFLFSLSFFFFFDSAGRELSSSFLFFLFLLSLPSSLLSRYSLSLISLYSLILLSLFSFFDSSDGQSYSVRLAPRGAVLSAPQDALTPSPLGSSGRPTTPAPRAVRGPLSRQRPKRPPLALLFPL